MRRTKCRPRSSAARSNIPNATSLGGLLGKLTRHLCSTATPHNGKEEDFQLFLALLDQDRFEGRFREGVQKVDVSDMMRHLVKEQLYKFDGTPLFPERLAYTVNYQLSALEDELYQEVTDYVRQEFNRADALENNGRKGTIGFALTTLQRRLASSPEAIYQSLRRRRERLERRLQEARQAKQQSEQLALKSGSDLPQLPTMIWRIWMMRPMPKSRRRRSRSLIRLRRRVRSPNWRPKLQLWPSLKHWHSGCAGAAPIASGKNSLVCCRTTPRCSTPQGHRRKLVIFTEHRDTLNYLVERIQHHAGTSGGCGDHSWWIEPREARMQAQEAFTQDKDVQILVATDAAGEGINLQRAHLMVNYDLPWNPNRT